MHEYRNTFSKFVRLSGILDKFRVHLTEKKDDDQEAPQVIKKKKSKHIVCNAADSQQKQAEFGPIISS